MVDRNHAALVFYDAFPLGMAGILTFLRETGIYQNFFNLGSIKGMVTASHLTGGGVVGDGFLEGEIPWKLPNKKDHLNEVIDGPVLQGCTARKEVGYRRFIVRIKHSPKVACHGLSHLDFQFFNGLSLNCDIKIQANPDQVSFLSLAPVAP